jgi:hypothetical protein
MFTYMVKLYNVQRFKITGVSVRDDFTNYKCITRPKTRNDNDRKDSREHEKQLP